MVKLYRHSSIRLQGIVFCSVLRCLQLTMPRCISCMGVKLGHCAPGEHNRDLFLKVWVRRKADDFVLYKKIWLLRTAKK